MCRMEIFVSLTFVPLLLCPCVPSIGTEFAMNNMNYD